MGAYEHLLKKHVARGARFKADSDEEDEKGGFDTAELQGGCACVVLGWELSSTWVCPFRLIAFREIGRTPTHLCFPIFWQKHIILFSSLKKPKGDGVVVFSDPLFRTQWRNPLCFWKAKCKQTIVGLRPVKKGNQRGASFHAKVVLLEGGKPSLVFRGAFVA